MIEPTITALDVQELKERALEFMRELDEVKAGLAPKDFWYPYSTLSNFHHLDGMLTGERRSLLRLIGEGPVADIGGADGDMAFFLERLGYRVDLVDNAPTNYNGLRGAQLLKEALSSSVEIADTDLDTQFGLPSARYGAVFFLGILYHLKNPYYALEKLAAVSRWCFVSTKIARLSPDHQTRLRELPLAYLLDDREANNDPSNYWIFSEAGLRRLVKRTGWEMRDLIEVGNTTDSDPASPEGDERAFCLLESSGW